MGRPGTARPGPDLGPARLGPARLARLIIRAVPGRPTCRRSGPGHGTKAHLPCRAGPINTPARRAAAVLPIPPPAMPRRRRRHPLAAHAALPRRRLQPVRPPPRRRPQLAQPLPRRRPQLVRSPPRRRPSAHGRRLATVRSPGCRRLAAVPSARSRLAAAPSMPRERETRCGRRTRVEQAGRRGERREVRVARCCCGEGKEVRAPGGRAPRGGKGWRRRRRAAAAGEVGRGRGKERGVELGFGDVYIHGLLGWSGRDFY